MKVLVGKEGLDKSKQDPFPETVNCTNCGNRARVAFVAYETSPNWGKAISNLHPSTGDDIWLHDDVAVAVYWCSKCFHFSVEGNQG